MTKPLVLCLGSEIISDDGFGPEVANRLRDDANLMQIVDVEAAALAGLALLDLLQKRPRVLIVDAMNGGRQEEEAPGSLLFFAADKLVATHNLVGSHQVSLPVALALGHRLGYDMPDTIDVLACVAKDLTRLRERLSPEVAEAVEPAVERVTQWASCRID